MILDDVSFLGIGNARSVAYMKELGLKGYIPASALVLNSPSGQLTPGQKSRQHHEDLMAVLDALRVPFEIIQSTDVNSDEVTGAVARHPERYFIYSGPGGAILGDVLLGTGKKFLHIHPGRVPDFRGSTTIYYHILAGEKCAASAIFLERKIDEGPLLKIREFDLPEDEDIDYEFDPRIRSELLGEVIGDYVRNGEFVTSPQPAGKGESYFIMHPVLRHIVRLRKQG